MNGNSNENRELSSSPGNGDISGLRTNGSQTFTSPTVKSFSLRSPADVRAKYLKKLGYTPLRFERTDGGSPDIRGHYNPSMTPIPSAGISRHPSYGSTDFKSPLCLRGLQPPLSTASPHMKGPDSHTSIHAMGKITTKGMFQAGSTFSSMLALLAATIGGGALALPYAFKLVGVLAGTIMMIASALLCVYTIRLLITCRNSLKLCSYEDLSQHCFGSRFAVFVEMNIIIFCFGTCVAYLIAIGDIVVPLAEEIFGGGDYDVLASRPLIIGFVGVFLMTPLSMVESVSDLKWANMFGLVVFMALVFSVCYRVTYSTILLETEDTRRKKRASDALDYLIEGSGSIWGVFSAIPTIFYSFCCHINVFSIYTELRRPSIRRMDRVVFLSCGVALTLYLALAFAAITEFGGETKEDILTNMGHRSVVMGTTQLLMAINIGLGFPMNVYPSRFTIEMLFFSRSKPSIIRSRVITIAFVLSTAIVAITIPNISVVFSVIGGSSAVLVSFVLPAAFYIFTRTGRIINFYEEPVASALLVISVVFGIVATVSSIVSSLYPHLLER